MFVFDIDDTISPTRPPEDWAVEHETRQVGWTIKIPTYVLEFMRGRDDIALLSTWGESAKGLADAFGINAQILVLGRNQHGIEGKFDLINQLDGVTAWVDDHIKPSMKKAMEEKGVTVIKPTRGVVSPRQIDTLTKLA